MPPTKMAQPARKRDVVNPFAHIEARKKAEADAKAAAVAKRKQEHATVRRDVSTKSWYDAPFDAMRAVGDYLRGVNR